MTYRKKGQGPFSALHKYIALSCILHGLLVYAVALPRDVSGARTKRGGSTELDQGRPTRSLTITIAAPDIHIPPQPSISNKKMESTSSPPRKPETEPLLPMETNQISRRRIYLDFELDTQAVPLLPPELDETLVLPEDEQGKMQILLLVSATGEVLWAYVEYTELTPETSEMLADRFRQTRFHPGQINQQAVDSLYRVEVNLAAAIPQP